MSALYWKNVSGNQAWENPGNWFTDAEASLPAANVPWLDGTDSTYLDYDLTSATGESSSPIMDLADASLNFGSGVTGSADFIGLTSDAIINGGSFTGNGFTNNNAFGINDGSFTGDGFANATYSCIAGGTFTGAGFINNGEIVGGAYSGYGLVNSNGSISDGTFTGADLINDSLIVGGTLAGSGFVNNAIISGGTFTSPGLVNDGSISGGAFTGSGLVNSGSISGGTFTGPGLVNSGSISGGAYAQAANVACDSFPILLADIVALLTPDPGFADNGGTYAPVVTVTGIPTGSDILGAGLL